MSVYRLDPIKLGDLRWQASTVKECLWAAAATPDRAREIVAARTAVVIAIAPSGQSAPTLQSPWLDDAITTCVLETSRNDVPDGAVIAADGRWILPA
jgi:hypothetical protein